MKHPFLYVSFIILQSGFLLAQPSDRKPRLSVDKTVIDLGKVYSGERKKIRLKIKNTGNDILRIASIQPSCGCTTVKNPKQSLRPGESDVVDLEFNSAGMGGTVEKHVAIETNDPSSPATITFKAAVINYFQVLKYGNNIYLGTRAVGMQFKETIELRNISGMPIKIRGVKAYSPEIKAESRRATIRSLDTARVTVTIQPLKEGYNQDQLFVETNLKQMPLISFRLSYLAVKPGS